MSASLALSRVHFPVTALGPGRRLGIWFQGCSIRCAGCISADTWGLGKHHVTVDEMLTQIAPWLAEADGVTISGGEPFDQPEALRQLLSGLRARTQADLLVYSGYQWSALAPHLQAMAGLIDALISGPYRRDVPQTLPLRGSDNQCLHCLSALGKQRFAALDQPGLGTLPKLDVMFDADGSVWMAGIPAHGDFQRLREQLGKQGYRVSTTQDRRRGDQWS